jgi:hypothetical protein
MVLMGSVHEFCAEFHISLAKARRMDKRGWLRVDTATTPIDEIRLALKKGARLTVAQLVELIENPAGVLELGKYSAAAQKQLDALGKVQGQEAPKAVASNILEAYQNQAEGVATVAAWVRSIIPAEPVGHAFVAVRLLLGVPANVRHYDTPRIQRALMNCRAHPALVGCWHTERQTSRNVTVYQKLALDL